MPNVDAWFTADDNYSFISFPALNLCPDPKTRLNKILAGCHDREATDWQLQLINHFIKNLSLAQALTSSAFYKLASFTFYSQLCAL